MLRVLSRFFLVFVVTLSSAWAQGIYLVPSGPIVADGEQVSTLHIWVPQLAEADKVKVKPATGKVVDVERLPSNVVAVQWKPARESAPRTLPVAVNIRKRGAAPLVADLAVALVPPTEGTITVKATPGEWAPNQGDIQVKITLSGTSAQSVRDRRVLVSASTGSITEAVPLGDGTFSARWSPPAENGIARTVVISAVDATSPSTIYGWTSLVLPRRASLLGQHRMVKTSSSLQTEYGRQGITVRNRSLRRTGSPQGSPGHPPVRCAAGWTYLHRFH